MSIQNLGKEGHDDFLHLKKKVTNMYSSQTLRIIRLRAHKIMNYISSFEHYT